MKRKTTKRFLPDVLIVCVVLVVALPVFLLRLGWGSLEPWDEAWYAEIGRNVTRGHIMVLESHGRAYYDHPPLGFWLMGLSFTIFDESEFAARLPMALAGLTSVVMMYFIGKALKNRWVGLMAAAILLSSRWFVYRARTGNLDALLVLMQLLVFYFSYRRRRLSDIYLAWLFLALALLTKSVISLTLLPLVLGATYSYFKRYRWQLAQLGLIGLLFFGPLLTWYGYNFKLFGVSLLQRNIWEVGLRKMSGGGLRLTKLKETIQMVQSLVHRWFKPFLVSISLGLMFINISSIAWVLAYLFLVAFPYVLSSKVTIWHMVPITAPMALLIALVINQVTIIAAQRLKTYHIAPIALSVLGLIGTLVLSGYTFFELLPELYRVTDEPSGQKILGSALRTYPGLLYLDSYENLATSVMYYADRQIIYLNTVTGKRDISNVQRPYSLLTRNKAYLGPDCQVVTEHTDIYAIHCLAVEE